MAKRKTPEPVKTLTGKPAGELIHMDPRELVMSKQVRTDVDEKADLELMESVKLWGVRQPIQGRRIDGRIHVTAGHRRTTAAIAAELATVPVYLETINEDDLRGLQLVENLQRLDMTLNETAAAAWELYTGPALGSAQQVAAMLGKPKSWVSKILTIADPQLRKHNVVVRQLMARDKLADLETAYLICKVEELDKATAEAIGKNIDEETRATITAKLKALKARADKNGGDGGDGGDGGNGGDPVNPGSDDPILTPDVLSFILRVVTDATVKPADFDRKTAAIAALREALGQD